MVGEHPSQAAAPQEDIKPAWRAACVAYRDVRRQGELHFPAWRKARAAVQELRFDLDEHLQSLTRGGADSPTISPPTRGGSKTPLVTGA